jgi:ankyrin repeat protein
LHLAAEAGSHKVLRQLLEAERLINLKEKGRYGLTPLFWAVHKNNN